MTEVKDNVQGPETGPAVAPPSRAPKIEVDEVMKGATLVEDPDDPAPTPEHAIKQRPAPPKPPSQASEETEEPEPQTAGDHADSKAKEDEEDQDILEVILPSAEPRKWKVGDQEYVQKPLAYVRKMQFFALIARALRAAMDQGGVDAAAELIGGGSLATRAGDLAQADIDEAGSFMNLILSLVEYAPDLITDAQCVWLNVPPVERPWVKAAWAGDLEDNGIEPMSDEEGKEMMKVFIVQNWDAIQVFFKEHVKEVVATARKQQENPKNEQ